MLVSGNCIHPSVGGMNVVCEVDVGWLWVGCGIIVWDPCGMDYGLWIMAGLWNQCGSD
jgi:hypothetical protein